METATRTRRPYTRHPRVPTDPVEEAKPQRVRPLASEAEEDALAAEIEAAAPMRQPMRAAMRDDDPRARAARRAAEIRGHLGDQGDGADEFFIAADNIPPGWDYEWKRETVMGQEDPAYQVAIAHAGWEPVPASRHPEMMPKGWSQETIKRKGLILCERPKEISDAARQRELRNARNQLQIKKQQLNEAPQGQFERSDPRVRAKIKTSYEPMPVPADE